ncbi:MAG: glycosyltransferase family 9 protein [Bacteriovoracia bacterium]
MILTTPFLREIRSIFPESQTYLVTTPIGVEVLDGIPNLNLIPLDKKKLGLRKSIQFVLEETKGIEFDFVFCVHRSFRSLLLTKAVRAKNKFVFKSFFSFLLGLPSISYPKYSEDIHYAEKPKELLKAAGFSVSNQKKPELVLSDADIAHWKSWNLESDYIVLNPFSNWGTKMWFADRYAQVASEISKELKVPIVVIGQNVPREKVISKTVCEKVSRFGGVAIDLVGTTSVAELKVLIAKARLLISNDSAPVHIAAAFDIPTVAVFGPTVRKLGFFPLSTKTKVVEVSGLECRPCSLHGPQKCPKRHFRCMDDIKVEQVVSAVKGLL